MINSEEMSKKETSNLDRLEEARNILLEVFDELRRNEIETDPKIKGKKFKELKSREKAATNIIRTARKNLMG